MNTISSLFKWIGDLIGANPNTLTTTSKTLIGAINEVDSEKVSKSGDTMTDNLTVSASGATTRNVKAENSTGGVYLNITGGGDHGVYSATKSKWLVHCDTSGNVDVNGINTSNIVRKDTANEITGGNFTVGASDTTERYVRAMNSAANVALDAVGSSGNHGVYSNTHSKWIAHADSSGNIYVNGVDTSMILKKRTAYNATLSVPASSVQSMVMINAVPIFVYCTGTSNIQVTSPYAQQSFASQNGTLTFNATGIGYNVTIKRLSTNYNYSVSAATASYIGAFYL